MVIREQPKQSRTAPTSESCSAVEELEYSKLLPAKPARRATVAHVKLHFESGGPLSEKASRREMPSRLNSGHPCRKELG